MSRQLYCVIDLPFRRPALALCVFNLGYPTPDEWVLYQRDPSGWRETLDVDIEHGTAQRPNTVYYGTGWSTRNTITFSPSGPGSKVGLVSTEDPGYYDEYSGYTASYCLYEAARDMFHYGRPGSELEAFLRGRYLAR